jgi:hypothetical protein
MTGLLSLALAAAVSASPPIALEAVRERGALKVTFQLLEPLPEAVETALPSGAVVRVRYPLRVRSPRRMWWDRKVWRGEVVATVTFDPVTGRYRGEVALDGVIVTSREFETAAAARELLTSPGPVLLALPVDRRLPNLFTRVRAVFSSSTKWLVFPDTEGTDWVEIPVAMPAPEEPSPAAEAPAAD